MLPGSACAAGGAGSRAVASGMAPAPRRSGTAIYLVRGVRSPKPHHFPVQAFVPAAAFGKWLTLSAISRLLLIRGCFGAGATVVPTGGFCSIPAPQARGEHWEAAFSLHRSPGTPEPLGASLALCCARAKAGRYPSPGGTHPAHPKGLRVQGPAGIPLPGAAEPAAGRARRWQSSACGDGDATAADVLPAQVLPGATRHPATLFSLLICGFSLQRAQSEGRPPPALPKGVPSSASRLCHDTWGCRGCRGRLAKPKGFALRPRHHRLGFSGGGSRGA